MSFSIAIIGRPNVGKSTLFNRLVGKRLALVHDLPGVTRDRREADAQLFDLQFKIVDTAGIEESFDESLEARMRRQTEQAVIDADLVLFVIDAREGVTPLDKHFAHWLRRIPTPVILLANKCEGRQGEAGAAEAYGLGFGDIVRFSAEHGLGADDLHEAISAHMEKAEVTDAPTPPESWEQDLPPEGDDLPTPADEAEQVLQLAIVGRPNVGKSTLVNRLLGEDRMLTGPEAGITRDSISTDWVYNGRGIRLIDTAGLRKRARITASLERMSAADTFRAVRYAQVVVLLLDVEARLEKQDLTIARRVIDEGRVLVIGVNKWDLCKDRAAALRDLSDRLERSLPQTRGVPVVTLSALRGQHTDRLLDAVFAAYDVWNRRIATAELNRWLEEITAVHPPPAVSGRRIRMKYMTQAKIRPPTFAVFCTKPAGLPESYLRYLENSLRRDFDLPGTPIRIHLRKGENPYERRK